MKHTTIFLVFALFGLALTGAHGQGLEGLKVALAVEASDATTQEALTRAMVKHLREKHGVAIVKGDASPDVVLRMSVALLQKENEVIGLSLAGSLESRLDEKFALSIYEAVPREEETVVAVMDFLRYLAEGNALRVATFHEIGGAKALAAVLASIDEGMRVIEKQQQMTQLAALRLLQQAARGEKTKIRPRLMLQ
jgi:hypothetical protein